MKTHSFTFRLLDTNQCSAARMVTLHGAKVYEIFLNLFLEMCSFIILELCSSRLLFKVFGLQFDRFALLNRQRILYYLGLPLLRLEKFEEILETNEGVLVFVTLMYL